MSGTETGIPLTPASVSHPPEVPWVTVVIMQHYHDDMFVCPDTIVVQYHCGICCNLQTVSKQKCPIMLMQNVITVCDCVHCHAVVLSFTHFTSSTRHVVPHVVQTFHSVAQCSG
jgi:hypothetical protein